jgi:hypothetical protein
MHMRTEYMLFLANAAMGCPKAILAEFRFQLKQNPYACLETTERSLQRRALAQRLIWC